MTTVRVASRPRIPPRARSSRSPVPFPRARARATVGARASTKSRDGDTSTGHDSSLSSIIIHQPSSIPPLSVDCIKITGRDPSRCPDRLASRVMSSSDRLDSTRLDSIDSTRLDRLDRLDSIGRSVDGLDRVASRRVIRWSPSFDRSSLVTIAPGVPTRRVETADGRFDSLSPDR